MIAAAGSWTKCLVTTSDKSIEMGGLAKSRKERCQEKMMKEWSIGEKLTAEEEETLEKDLLPYFVEGLKEENIELILKLEEMTKKAEEESILRAKAELEVKKGEESIERLMKILDIVTQSVVPEVREVRRKESEGMKVVRPGQQQDFQLARARVREEQMTDLQ